ncbi:MAG: hypothetical protein IPL43_10825 [Micropruina sp.]|nr:hypothetical protein [Micropruina sp.]
MSVAKQARLWQWAAVAYAVLAGLFLAFFPSLTVGSGDAARSVALWTVAGPAVLLPLALPAVIAAIPAVLPWRKTLVAWIVAGVFVAFIVGTLFSVGLIYVPVAAFGVVSGYLHQRAPIEDAPPEPDTWHLRNLG